RGRRRGAPLPVPRPPSPRRPKGRLTDSQRFQLRHLIHAPWSRFDFISCYQKSLDLPAVRFFRAMGVPVTAWTIRSAAEAREVAGRADQLVFEGFDPDRV
ncbi:MAG: hypothetical protein HY371_09645, partial [Devosia nanyangense]|nr:hypothetical protein [Devosia nanyangense]